MNLTRIRNRAEKDHAVLPSEVINLLDELEVAIGLLERYHEHVCSSAPVSWAAKGDYAESAYDWERHWQTLCKEPTEAFLDKHRSKGGAKSST